MKLCVCACVWLDVGLVLLSFFYIHNDDLLRAQGQLKPWETEKHLQASNLARPGCWSQTGGTNQLLLTHNMKLHSDISSVDLGLTWQLCIWVMFAHRLFDQYKYNYLILAASILIQWLLSSQKEWRQLTLVILWPLAWVLNISNNLFRSHAFQLYIHTFFNTYLKHFKVILLLFRCCLIIFYVFKLQYFFFSFESPTIQAIFNHFMQNQAPSYKFYFLMYFSHARTGS